MSIDRKIEMYVIEHRKKGMTLPCWKVTINGEKVDRKTPMYKYIRAKNRQEARKRAEQSWGHQGTIGEAVFSDEYFLRVNRDSPEIKKIINAKKIWTNG